MRKLITTLCLITAILTPLAASADMEAVKIAPLKVTEQIYMLTGQGGNLGVFVGADGTFLIDDQYAPLTGKIVAAIKTVGGDIPKFMLNTHYHGDHTGGNENLGKEGTLIFSHDNVRESLRADSFIQEFEMKSAALSKAGLPIVTFSKDISFHLNNDTVHAIHVPHAHTDGDSFIYFKNANVIHAGDIFFNGFYPFIDVNHGGSLKGVINAVDLLLSMADDNTKIIPGHGPLADKTQLKSYRQMLSTAYDRLRAIKGSGQSVAEAIAAKPLADLEVTWGNGLFKGDRWIEIIYNGVY